MGPTSNGREERGKGGEGKGRKGEGREGRGGEDPLDLLPPEKFPSYATGSSSITISLLNETIFLQHLDEHARNMNMNVANCSR